MITNFINTHCHDITEILLKVVLNIITHTHTHTHIKNQIEGKDKFHTIKQILAHASSDDPHQLISDLFI
jgi:hypothetical protein